MEEWVEEHRRELEEVPAQDGRPAKIRCLVTGHEVKRELDAVKAHWDGRRFKARVAAFRRRLEAGAGGEEEEAFSMDAYYPHVTPHKFPESMVYGHITKSRIHKNK